MQTHTDDDGPSLFIAKSTTCHSVYDDDKDKTKQKKNDRMTEQERESNGRGGSTSGSDNGGNDTLQSALVVA
jgi:hypothetical protein